MVYCGCREEHIGPTGTPLNERNSIDKLLSRYLQYQILKLEQHMQTCLEKKFETSNITVFSS